MVPNLVQMTAVFILACTSRWNKGCMDLRGSNHIILIGGIKFGDLVLSIVERYLIQCPFFGGSSLRGSTVLSAKTQLKNV